jgi:predicted ATPase
MLNRVARPIPLVNRVQIANFKSIQRADVHLGALNVLVGLNGAGKATSLTRCDSWPTL